MHATWCVLHVLQRACFNVRVATCRLCKATGATALARIGGPTPEELGSATSVEVRAVLCLPQRTRQCTCALAARIGVVGLLMLARTRARRGFGLLRRGWLRSQQDRSVVTVGRAGCLICCNVHRSMQQNRVQPSLRAAGCEYTCCAVSSSLHGRACTGRWSRSAAQSALWSRRTARSAF